MFYVSALALVVGALLQLEDMRLLVVKLNPADVFVKKDL